MTKNNKKYIFITGGVTSSLGKGLASASIASLLERRGVKIAMLKMDPYINVDPGAMSPIEHGEVFVTDDGGETDLDIGHYERFTSLTLNKDSNFTSGKVYQTVIDNEREGKYLGSTVQVVPHITNEIKNRIYKASENADLLLGEIGGTVGDIESLPFLEAIRQFSLEVGTSHVLFIHLVLLPYIAAAKELKSKPAQHSVKELRSIGIIPQIIICRSDRAIEEDVIGKISLFCNVPKDQVFKSIDVNPIYKVPLSFYEQKLDEKVTELLNMWTAKPKMDDLERVIANYENPLRKVKIGIVGKYTELIESYKSLDEAIRHGSLANQVQTEPIYIDAHYLENHPDEIENILNECDGILIPGGFGNKGVEGKLKAIEYARTKKVPFFGICLGFQLAVIEFARHVAGMIDANSEEFVTTKDGTLVIHYEPGQYGENKKVASMRLGAYDCELKNNTMIKKIYNNKKVISERHRHRFEFNNTYREILESKGLMVSGVNTELNLVETIEIEGHPFFIACQYHPEFKSRPFLAHPLFLSFVKAVDTFKMQKLEKPEVLEQ